MFQYLFLTSVHKRNAKNLMEVSEIPEFEKRIFRMMSSDAPPKPILSAITFPITLSLDRTVYLSYYSRYSRFCYFDHFFCPYLRIHWTDFAHLKDNIVGNKISYNVGQHHFFCICHISRDFLKK